MIAPDRPSGFTAPHQGDTGSFGILIDVGGSAPMSSVTEIVLGLQAFTDIGGRWGTALAKSAAMWDLAGTIERNGPFGLSELLELEQDGFINPKWWPQHRRHSPEWWLGDAPELLYLRDVRATRLAGKPIRVQSLTYENPIELTVFGAGLLLLGTVMAARFVRDWSANRQIGRAEARKAEAEARVSETWAEREEAITETMRSWLAREARQTSTPLPIDEMAAVTSMHNFPDLRRVIEHPVVVKLPDGLDPTADDEQ